MDYQPGSPLCAQKKRRDWLIELATTHPDWVLGFQDEVWWSRFARPSLKAWSAGPALRLQQLSVDPQDAGPKALSCYGLLRADTGQMLLRFVKGRPVSQVTEDFLEWVCERLASEGKKALLMIWDNASWHISHRVRASGSGRTTAGPGPRVAYGS